MGIIPDRVSTIIWFHHLDFNEKPWEKSSI